MNNDQAHITSKNISFIGGVAFALLNAFKQLLDNSHMSSQDILKALTMGIIGAIGSGLGAWFFKTSIKPNLEKLIKKIKREKP